jgi:NADP-dependent 3-hydroxy acid dehydrogenase YdfG
MPSPEPVMLITGASSGIGAATARRALSAGYRLVLGARGEDRLTQIADELGDPERVLTARCDVMRWSDNEAIVAAALQRFGRLDVAFANAGFGARRGWLEESPEIWHDMVNTNVLGAAYTIRACLPAIKQSAGHVLLTGSVAGHLVMPGSLYSVTKWAVGAMAEAVRADLNDTGVRTTLISPGAVQTPFFDEPREGRLDPDDIARAVMYALQQPPHVDVNEIFVRPTAQKA